jgi:hypothetical protein
MEHAPDQVEHRSRQWAVRAVTSLIGLGVVVGIVDVNTSGGPELSSVATGPVTEFNPEPVTLAPASTPDPRPKPTRPHLEPSPRTDPRPSTVHQKRRAAHHFGPLTIGQFEASPRTYLAKLPTLDVLNKVFPEVYTPEVVAEDKAQIAQLKAAVQPTVEGYKNLRIDTSHNTAFSPHPYYNRRITMRMEVNHWTDLPDDMTPLELVSFMLHRRDANGQLDRVSVDLYEGHQANPEVSQLIPDETHMTASAAGANDFSESLEIAGESDNGKSPLLNLTAKQLEVAIETDVKILRRNHLPIKAWTLMGHQDVDLLFHNVFYDPATGKFKAGAVLGKCDPPHEVMSEIVVPEAIRLDAALTAAGIKN